MTQIKMFERENGFLVQLREHVGFGEYGQEFIGPALSFYVYLMRHYLLDLNDRGGIRDCWMCIEPGYAELEAEGTPEGIPYLMCMYRASLNLLQELRDLYPQSVSLYVFERHGYTDE